MRLNVGVLSAAVVLTCAPFSIAGPLFPCPTAVNSVHGNAIAVAHRTIEWHAGIGKSLGVQFTVMKKTDFVNDSQKISAPVTYWGDWPWAVVLDMNDQANRISYFCAAPLVTDDAQFLILLATGPVFDSADSALRVYRKGDDSSERMQDGTVKGVLVRDIKLEELWPATKIDSSRLATDYRPEWFAGGSFDFAPGNLQLIHKTRWGTTVRINLPDGKTLKDQDLGCFGLDDFWLTDLACALLFIPSFVEGQDFKSQQQSSATPLLRRVVVEPHGFDDGTTNDTVVNEQEQYLEKHLKDRPS